MTGVDARTFAADLLRFRSTDGAEAAAAEWFESRLSDLGFETYRWGADAETLAGHDSFPDDPDAVDAAGRPSVAGVAEFGAPDAGPTLVLNGHLDVVPADDALWDTDPFEPAWNAVDPADLSVAVDVEGRPETLTARGAADMKAALTACVFAAADVRTAADVEPAAETATLDGRLVVEAVAGEEIGGVGAATAAVENPYPFERDAAVVAEPTGLTPVIAVEGTVMKRLRVEGRSAHAATRLVGEDVLPHFEAIRRRLRELEAERCRRVSHPLYDEYELPWPIVAGRVEAGSWSSTVPGELTAEFRIGVAPGETVAEVEAAVESAVAEVVADRPWLADHPPEFERFAVQFEPAETDADAAVVRALRAAMTEAGLDDTAPRGATYGADSRHYVAAGIPTVLFGPGHIERAHFPNETVPWAEVERARDVLAATARRFLGGD